MANRKKKGKEPVSCTFSFEGGLESSVRGGLIIELIKYILYERQQIPLPYDALVTELEKFTAEASHEGPRLHHRRQKLHLKRAINAISNLQKMFKEISNVFEQCPEIRQVLLVLGSTTISPKESYLVNLPASNPEADNLTLKSCSRSLFRQLIMQDILGGMKAAMPTSLMVLVYAPRSIEMSWFLPNSTFKFPIRGEQFKFDFVDQTSLPHNRSVAGDKSIDVSGIEPLESSVIDLSLIEKAQHLLDTTDSYGSSFLSEEDGSSQGSTLALLKPLNSSLLSSQNSVTSNSSSIHSLRKLSNDIEDLPQSSTCKKQRLHQVDGNCVIETSVMTKNGESNDVVEDEDDAYMWFQTPIKFKGYKNKSKR